MFFSRYFLSLSLGLSLAAALPPPEAGAGEKNRDPDGDAAMFAVPDTPGNRTLPIAKLTAARQRKNGAAIRQLLASIPVTAGNRNVVDFWRGMSRKCEKRYEEAGEQFDKCTDFGELSVEGQAQVAETYLYLEQYDKSLKILTPLIKKQPNFDCLELRGRCYTAAGKPELALPDLIAAAKLQETKSRSLLARAAEILRRQNKPKEALAVLKMGDANKEHSGDAPFYLSKAVCYEDLGQWKEAAEACSRALQVSMAGCRNGRERAGQLFVSRSLLERAKCYDHLGRRDLAAADRAENGKFSSEVEDDFMGK
ncbi:MAG: tetratricopeptide repeat protein [Cyanobacteria bacterium SZAS TMP-1]|nr:tetratricopeptide repeat protein [Cyanobacteria bacterium SZAS TMP-1]